MAEKIYISNIESGSIAEEAGIEKGDILLAINGNPIKDIFDYRFLASEEELVLEIEKPHGEIWEIEVEKDVYEDLGIEFENPMLDEACTCTNKCIFCFIDQLPKGMRDTLYFKDDDSRLSFLSGNYVTLTNMKDEDIDRIIKYRMSPINVSVHTTDPDLRVLMLKNRFAGNILARIKKLVSNGITVNCQIVLCRDINDKDNLEKTISELAELYPGIQSISVVPVGITRYRENLPFLKPFDKDASEEVLDQINNWQNSFLKEKKSRIVFAADEFYILAGRKLPPIQHYEEFPQLENGVGLVSLLIYQVKKYLKKIKPSAVNREISIATGVSVFSYIKYLSEYIQKKFKGLIINVYAIKNEFFGENVTVAGLLTGQDILKQLRGKKLGQELLISRSMLKAEEDVFLDNVTLAELSKELNVKIVPVLNEGKDFVTKVLGS